MAALRAHLTTTATRLAAVSSTPPAPAVSNFLQRKKPPLTLGPPPRLPSPILHCPPMQVSARLASSAASKRVIACVGSTITRSSYRASRGKAHAAPLSAQESPPPKGQKRISKHERRIMIEEFVDKYRASNEGRFPSIKCVRQQIGGGHYTVREILQELEYNHANPPMDNAKAVQGATQVATHSRSTNESKSGQAQETAHFAGKNPDNLVALKNDQLDDVQHSLKDATAGTVTIEKHTETGRSMDFVHIVEKEATKSDFSISDSVKNADDRTLSHQTERDSMNDLTDEPAVSLGVEAKSDPGNQERETEVNKLDLNKTGNSLNSSKSIVSDQSGSDKVIKGNMAHSEHGPKQELQKSTEAGLLGSLKSFASEIKNFWKRL